MGTVTILIGSIDSTETLAPVAKATTFRLIMAFAHVLQLHVNQIIGRIAKPGDRHEVLTDIIFSQCGTGPILRVKSKC